MPCGLAPLAVTVALAGPMCPRLDRSPAVLAALQGEAVPAATSSDPALAAALAALGRPVPSSRRKARR